MVKNTKTFPFIRNMQVTVSKDMVSFLVGGGVSCIPLESTKKGVLKKRGFWHLVNKIGIDPHHAQIVWTWVNYVYHELRREL